MKFKGKYELQQFEVGGLRLEVGSWKLEVETKIFGYV